MLDGVLFLDEPGRLVLGLPFNSESSFSVNNLTSVRSTEISRIPETGHFIELGHSQLMYQRRVGNLQMHIPCSVSEPPATVEELGNAIVTVIETYFGQAVTQSLLESNKAKVVLLLSEMFDAGLPRMTEPDILKQLVPPDNLFKWLLPGTTSSTPSRSAVDAAASGSAATGSQAQLAAQQHLDDRIAWELPWRRARVKHTKQELYVDVIENVKILVMSKSGQQRKAFSNHIIPTLPSRVQVSGKIVVLSKLNGSAPYVSIELQGSFGGIGGARLHQCVDRPKWIGSHGHNLAFVPPDGESVVMTYRTVVTTQGPVLAELRQGDNTAASEVRLATVIDTKVNGINNLVAKVVYPSETKLVKELSSTGGDFDVSNPQCCILRFEKNVPMGWQATLRASAFNANDEPVSPLYVEIGYSLVGRVPSQATVKGIHIVQNGSQPALASANEVKPFKGVRYQTIADSYVVR